MSRMVCANKYQPATRRNVLARAKRERVVQDGVEKANRRPTRHDPTDTAPLAPYLKFDHF